MDFLAQGKSWRVEGLLTTSINDLHRFFCRSGVGKKTLVYEERWCIPSTDFLLLARKKNYVWFK